jgi:hypothetical protein
VLFRTCSVLLVLLSSCATPGPRPNGSLPPSPRLANLQRAAALPWTDDGQCVVREAEDVVQEPLARALLQKDRTLKVVVTGCPR